jgi:hypothetical protein
MAPIGPDFVWTADCIEWLAATLRQLNWSYVDLDDALGFGPSRGSYTRQVLECGRAPSMRYRIALERWWNRNPQRKFSPTLLLQIQAVAVPWLRAREGQPVTKRTYTRRQARLIRRQHHAS